MYAWIDKDEVVDIDDVIAVLDISVASKMNEQEATKVYNKTEPAAMIRGKTAVLMIDGRLILVAARRKAVAEWLSRGRLERSKAVRNGWKKG